MRRRPKGRALFSAHLGRRKLAQYHMDKKEAQKRVHALRKTINYHRHNYHVLDTEEISAEALDSLKKELFDIEQMFPDLVTADSPTQRVAGAP